MSSYWVDTHSHIFLLEPVVEDDSAAKKEQASLVDKSTLSSIEPRSIESKAAENPPPRPRGLPSRIEAALARADEAGVRRVVVVGIDPRTSQVAASISAADSRCVATAGLHPNEAGSLTSTAMAVLEELARCPWVSAIGETGLDLYRERATLTDQEEAFRFHIDLARRVSKPLVIHVREAHAEVRRVLEDEARSGTLPPLVMHCFSGSRADAESYLSLGAYLSFAGPITFQTANAKELREVAAWVPLDRCLLETDSPYLSPRPYRGKPNEPARTALIGRELARLKNLSEEEVASATTASASTLFFEGG